MQNVKTFFQQRARTEIACVPNILGRLAQYSFVRPAAHV